MISYSGAWNITENIPDIEVDKYQFYGGQTRGLDYISTCQHAVFLHPAPC